MHWNNTSSTIFFRFSLISKSILNRFSCNFADTIPSHYDDCPENLAKFDWVLQKLLMRCTETTLLQPFFFVFRWYLSQFSTVFHVFRRPPPQPWRRVPWKFGEVWLSTSKVITAMHWNSTVSTPAERCKCRAVTKTALSQCPPSYMYDWAVQTDWQIIQSKRVIANTPATLTHYLSPSFFFFFFFFFF